MPKNKTKVLVTGADGFIGSHLVEKLLKLGFYVKATSMYNAFNSNGWLDEIKNKNRKLSIKNIDLADPNITDQLVKDCDYVLHLAALVGIPYSYISPNSYVTNNIVVTLNLLQSAYKHKIKKFIHTSTSEIYGNSLKQPISENFNPQAFSPYSATKIASDQLAMSFYRSYDLPVTIIRPFNTFGPRQSLRAVIPTIILQMLKNPKNIKIGLTSPTRDFTFVDDSVEGFIKALLTKKKVSGEIINLGTGSEISVNALIQIISKKISHETIIKTDNKRLRPKKSEVYRLKSNNKKAKKLLNWEPQYKGKKNFLIALDKTIEWYSNKNHLKLFKEKDYVI